MPTLNPPCPAAQWILLPVSTSFPASNELLQRTPYVQILWVAWCSVDFISSLPSFLFLYLEPLSFLSQKYEGTTSSGLIFLLANS